MEQSESGRTRLFGVVIDFWPPLFAFLLLPVGAVLSFVQTHSLALDISEVSFGWRLFLALFVAIPAWWLLVTWAGWVPLLLFALLPFDQLEMGNMIGGFLVLYLGLLPCRIMALLVIVQKGYLNFWQPGWGQRIRNHSVIDARIGVRRPWLSFLHPLRFIVRRALEVAPERLTGMALLVPLTAQERGRQRQFWIDHWPVAVWFLVCFLVANTVEDYYLHHVFLGIYFFLPIWWLLLPWAGLTPVLVVGAIGLLGPSLFAWDQDIALGVALAGAIVLIQKGYLAFWRSTWKSDIRRHWFIDVRISRRRYLMTVINPLFFVHILYDTYMGREPYDGAEPFSLSYPAQPHQ